MSDDTANAVPRGYAHDQSHIPPVEHDHDAHGRALIEALKRFRNKLGDLGMEQSAIPMLVIPGSAFSWAWNRETVPIGVVYAEEGTLHVVPGAEGT